MSEKNEKQIAQLFRQQVQKNGDTVYSKAAVAQVIAQTNRETGLRDVIELFITSTLKIFLGLLAPLSVKAQKSLLKPTRPEIKNNNDNKIES